MAQGTCSAEGCGESVRARGMCIKHYDRFRKSPDFPRRDGGVCAAEGCERTGLTAKGLCDMHYRRQRPPRDLGPCTVPECTRRAFCQGLCPMHYQRLRANGEVGQPHPIKSVSRVTSIKSHGYVLIWVGDEKVLEHRHVMSCHIGRPLWPDENVHHLNGDRADNRITNLELWSSSQPAGQRVEDKADWAVEILRRYRPDALK